MSEKTFSVMDVTVADTAFGCGMEFLPKMEDIPEEFHRPGRGSKWHEFQTTWFYLGLKNLKIRAKPGINESKAMAHLAAIQRSFAPKHEHKAAAVAWLASLWFEDVEFEPAKTIEETMGR